MDRANDQAESDRHSQQWWFVPHRAGEEGNVNDQLMVITRQLGQRMATAGNFYMVRPTTAWHGTCAKILHQRILYSRTHVISFNVCRGSASVLDG